MSDDSGSNDSGVNDNEEGLSNPLRRWRAVGDVEDVRRIQWRAIRAAERVMYDERATRSEVLAAATRITQATRAYLKVMEVAEIEERLDRLEDFAERYQQRREHINGRTG